MKICRNTKVSLTIVLSLLFFVTCQPVSDDKTDEDADPELHQSEAIDEEGSYLLPGLDHGLLQSPINILSKETMAGQHIISLNFSGEIEMVENLGHTVQLDFVPGNTITVDGRSYEYKQMHFHTPSEHLVDGITYPMEMHAVTTLKDQPEGETTEYLVLGFLLKMGEENEFIRHWLDQVPEEEGDVTETSLNTLKNSKMGNVANLLEEIHDSYHYKGSLTTPPYTESVNWYVMKKIFEASPEQIMRINQIEGDNARHIQARYERSVSEE